MSQKRETMTFKSMHRNNSKIMISSLNLLDRNQYFRTIHCITGIAVSSAISCRCRCMCPPLLFLPPPQALLLSVCPMPPPPLLQFAVKDTMEYRGLPVDTRLGEYCGKTEQVRAIMVEVGCLVILCGLRYIPLKR